MNTNGSRHSLRLLVFCLAAAVSLCASGQTERWVRTYDGPAHQNDITPCTILGDDGNVYSVGFSPGTGSGNDIVLLSLDPAGQQRWVYRYDNEQANDGANAVVYGAGDRLYIAGQSAGPPSNTADLVVICLDTAGNEQWVYRYDGPGHVVDGAYDIHEAPDGNLYVAGYSGGSGTQYDAVVISLKPDGTERWVYRYDGAEHEQDRAYCIVSGIQDMIYAGGYSSENIGSEQQLVLGLDTSGTEKFVYHGGASYGRQNAAYALMVDPDGQLLVAGTAADHDFSVSRHEWKTGAPFWHYIYPTATFNQNRANAIVCSDSDHIYVAGSIEVMLSMNDFVVVSLDKDGNLRWMWRTDGSDHTWDEAWDLTLGAEGTVYATGELRSETLSDLLVVALDDGGQQLWQRRFNGSATAPGNDRGDSVVPGEDGHIYVGGFLTDAQSLDIAVIKLDTDNTVGAEISAVPSSGTLPFDTDLTVDLSNHYAGLTRTVSARVDLTLANGALHSGWRQGYVNVQAGESFSTTLTVHLPAIRPLAGENRFDLAVQDTTRAPYNQPPYPPSGDTDTDSCAVIGLKSP